MATGDLLLTLDDPAPHDSDVFGWALTGVGALIAVSDPFDLDQYEFPIGAVHLFDASGALLRTMIHPVIEQTPGLSMEMLCGLSLAAAGSDLVVGSPGSFGSAFVYDADPQSGGFGTVRHQLAWPPPGSFAPFAHGYAVAAGGGHIFVTDPFGQFGGASGGVHVYDGATGGYLDTLQDPTHGLDEHELASEEDLFAASITVLGDSLLVQADVAERGGRRRRRAELRRHCPSAVLQGARRAGELVGSDLPNLQPAGRTGAHGARAGGVVISGPGRWRAHPRCRSLRVLQGA